jgi:hypothetical protein
MSKWGVTVDGRPLVLHKLAPKMDEGARILPLWISKWGATVDGRPLVLHELAPENDGGARISPFQVLPLWISEWGMIVNGGAVRDGARCSWGICNIPKIHIQKSLALKIIFKYISKTISHLSSISF